LTNFEVNRNLRDALYKEKSKKIEICNAHLAKTENQVLVHGVCCESHILII
jgi:hypothetical protein